MKSKPERKNLNEKGNSYEQNKRKTPKKITPTYLHNSGLYYLERFAASKEHFKSVMMRKAKRSCLHHKDQNYDACVKMVGELADKFESCGLLNDDAYAKAIVSSLRRKGLSSRAITIKMRSKGIAIDKTMSALKELDSVQFDNERDAEIAAAIRLARKKKIGVFFIGEEQNIKRSLGMFARAGFSYDIAQNVINMTLEEIEETEANTRLSHI